MKHGYLLLLYVVVFSGCKPEKTENKDILAKTHLFLNDEIRDTCATQEKWLRRDDSQVGDKIRSIILNSGHIDSNRPSVCAEKLAVAMHGVLQQQEATADLIHRKVDDPSYTDYDVITVGGGLHASIFARNLSLQYPTKKILTIDDNKSLAEHFRGNVFHINSPINHPSGKQTNIFPNAPIQIHEYESVKPNTIFTGYPFGQSIWNEIVFSHFVSSSDFLVGFKINSISKEESKNQIRYVVDVDKFGKIYTKKLVVAGGLGEPKLISDVPQSFIDQQRKEVHKCKYEGCLPKLMSFDDMISIGSAHSTQTAIDANANSISSLLRDKKVALIGGGDSAIVAWEIIYTKAIEELAFIMSHRLALNTNVTRPSELLWIGPKFLTYEEFSERKDIKPRYKNNPSIAQLFSDAYAWGTRIGKNTKATKIEPLKDKVRVHFDNPIFGANSADFDHVILTTGYDTNARMKLIVANLLSASDRANTYEELFPIVEVGNKPCARKLKTGNGWEEIYVIGAAAVNIFDNAQATEATLPTKSDLENSITKNSVSINVLAPYTEYFAKSLQF